MIFKVQRDNDQYEAIIPIREAPRYRAYIASIGHTIVSETAEFGEDLGREAGIDELIAMLPRLRLL